MEYRVEDPKEQTTLVKDGHIYDKFTQMLYDECDYNSDCNYSGSYINSELCCIGDNYYSYDTYCDYSCDNGQFAYDYYYSGGSNGGEIGWGVTGSVFALCFWIWCIRICCCARRRTVVVRQPVAAPQNNNQVVVVNNTTTTTQPVM